MLICDVIYPEKSMLCGALWLATLGYYLPYFADPRTFGMHKAIEKTDDADAPTDASCAAGKLGYPRYALIFPRKGFADMLQSQG